MAVQPAKHPTLTIKVELKDQWSVKRALELAPELVEKIDGDGRVVVKSVSISGS